MSSPHMNLRGLDSKSKVDVKQRVAHYAKMASFMNADPDEIGKSCLAHMFFSTAICPRYTEFVSEYLLSCVC